MKQFLIVGMGKFGTSLAKTLYDNGKNILALDIEEEKIQENINNNIIENGIAIDATDRLELKNLGINNFDVAFVCIGKEIQNSILVTLTLKELGIPKIIAKALSKQHGRVLEKVGADEVIYPEIHMGKKVALKEIRPNLIEHIQLSNEYTVIEVKAPTKFLNKTLIELDLRKKYNLNIIAIKRKNDGMEITPMGDSILKKDDKIIAIADKETAKELKNLKLK